MSVNAASNNISRLKEILLDANHYRRAAAMLSVHSDTIMPPANSPFASKTKAFHSRKAHELSTSSEMRDLLTSLREGQNLSQLSNDDQILVKRVGQSFDKDSKIPGELVGRISEATGNSRPIWIRAKNENDFPSFIPSLREIFDLKKEISTVAGSAASSPYDFHLDSYEEGMTVAKLDEVFKIVKSNVVPLIQAIKDSGVKISTNFLQLSDTSNQMQLATEVLNTIGFDFNRGRIAKTEHGFCFSVFPDETVIGLNHKTDLGDFMGLVIHEGGHAIHGQGIDKSLYGTPLYSGPSLGINESQSRLYENHIGKSLPFWKFYLDKLKKHYPIELRDITPEQFYKAMNSVKDSLIRVQADEITYNLHVILRYEIERDIFEGRVEIKDLPELWASKMKEYLGIEPKNDTEGVLQDIHWSYGSIGYFPTYTLGNIAAAQIFAQMQKEIPHLDSLIESGSFTEIREWLNDKVHKYGDKLSPEEVLTAVTGRGYDSSDLAAYQKAKFSDIYGLGL